MGSLTVEGLPRSLTYSPGVRAGLDTRVRARTQLRTAAFPVGVIHPMLASHRKLSSVDARNGERKCEMRLPTSCKPRSACPSSNHKAVSPDKVQKKSPQNLSLGIWLELAHF